MKAYVEVNGSGVRASLTVSSTIASFWWKSPQVEASMEACMKASDWKSVVFSCHVLPWTCQTHPRKLLRRLSWKSTEVGSTEASTCRKLPRKLVHGTFHVPGESTAPSTCRENPRKLLPRKLAWKKLPRKLPRLYSVGVCGFRLRVWESYRTSRSFGYVY